MADAVIVFRPFFSSEKVIVLMYPKIKLALAATYIIDSYGIYSKGKSLRQCFSNLDRMMTESRGKGPSHLYPTSVQVSLVHGRVFSLRTFFFF